MAIFNSYVKLPECKFWFLVVINEFLKLFSQETIQSYWFLALIVDHIPM